MSVSVAKGFNTSAVIVPESTYGELAETGQKALPLVSETLTRGYDYMQEEVKRAGGVARLKTELGYQNVAGTTICEFDMDNCNELLEAGIGSVAGGVYTPTAELEKIYSIVVDKELIRHQFLGLMCNELRIRGGVGNPKTLIENDWVGKSMTPSASAIPTASLTTPDQKVKHSQLTVLIGDTSNALAGTDAIPVVSYLLTIRNNLKLDYASGSAHIIQPIRETVRQVTLELTTPYYDSSDEVTAIMTAAAAHTIMQASFTWADGDDTFTLLLPELYLSSYPNQNVSGHQALPFTVTFDCMKNVNNATHMATAANLDLLLTKT